MKNKALKKLILRGLFYVLVALALFYTIFPFYWAVNTSLTTAGDLSSSDVSYVPTPPVLSSYYAVLKNNLFLSSLWNSVIVAGGATILSLVIGSLAACALGRYRFKGRKPVLYLILAMTMFPQIAIVGSLYEMIAGAGLFNTRIALIISYMLTTLPFTIWVLTSFFRSLPKELEESAYVDGAGPVRTFLFILLPLSAPGLVTTGLLAFIASWNEYLFALSFTIDEKAKTVPVVVAQFSGATEFEIPWGQIMAGSIVATLPLIILVFIFQRRIISGMTAGAVKG